MGSGFVAKQADALLLVYPLNVSLDKATMGRMLDFYTPRVSLKGPAMTASMETIVAARLGRRQEALDLFHASYRPFVRGPWDAFSENSGGGAGYFCTGMGGCLQSVLYGFAGLQVVEPGQKGNGTKIAGDSDASLYADPHLPPGWGGLTVKGVRFRGRTFDLNVMPGKQSEGRASMIPWLPRLRPLPRLRDFYRNPLLRLRMALLLGAFILTGGTLGYMVLEHYSFLDALFMTVITLSSVGYGLIKPLDVAGTIFTIVLILFGLGTAAWLFTTIIETFVSEQTLLLLSKKRMTRQVNALKNHYIVCGYGRIGQQIALGYTQNKVPYLVIEQEPSRLEMLREADTPMWKGTPPMMRC